MASTTTSGATTTAKAVAAHGVKNNNNNNTNNATSNNNTNKNLPTIRDSKYGWLNFAVLLYCMTVNTIGLGLFLSIGRQYQHQQQSLSASSFVFRAILGILCSAHGRILSSYLVHEAAHANIFIEPWANRWFGIACLWTAGCSYADFGHVKWMHMSHHNDRADTVEFDYRSFVNNRESFLSTMFGKVVLACEYCFIPAVETIMHIRTSIYPLICSKQVTPERHLSSLLGTPAFLFYYHQILYCQGGRSIIPVMLQIVSGAVVIQFLALNDAFHHTYEAIRMADYIPGPGTRTAQYEEDNTYSNLISLEYPIWNAILALNFGYHNAHHQKAMTPWYNLPDLHNSLYRGNHGPNKKKDDTSASTSATSTTTTKTNFMPQILPYSQIFQSWYRHRLQRVVDDDYGYVAPVNDDTHPTNNRAEHFVGALGVSFLTV